MAAPWIDSVVIVTGASAGIGRELARQMAPQARALAIVARRRDRLEELAAELRGRHPALEVFVRPTDLCDLEECEALIDETQAALGPIDVLVNNAGFGDIGAFDLADWERLHAMIRLNVTSLTYLTHRLYPTMVSRAHGGILNISSGYGLFFMPSFATYVGTKHYVSALTESLHIEAGALGVTVTQVCPGPVETEFEKNIGNFTGRDAPSIMYISAAMCARHALRGFARGRALVVPGLVVRSVMWLGAWTPRWFLRLLYRPIARWFRKKELAARP